jgi:hypothetical protein
VINLMRNFTISCTSLCLAAASLSAQNYLTLPATAAPASELTSYSLLPFMQPNARVQVFYDTLEVASGPVVLNQLELRYDGPIPAVGAPGPFSITRLQIKVGVSTIATPGADFAANLTTPLVTVFDAPWSYLPDPGSAYPHPWGAPNGALTFPFTTNVPLALAAGEWLVVEIAMEGNNIASFGFAHAILDGVTTTGGFSNGSTTAYGQGCAAATGAAAATASVSGLYGPGGVHRLAGGNLGANAAALAVFGLSNTTAFVPLPWTLPGTNCTLLASPDVTVLTFADASGSIAGTQAVALSLPANPAFSGVVLYEQFASLVPTANPWGIVLSNAVAVTLGSWTPLGRGTFLVAHDTDANATYANSLRAFGYAMRLRTL